MYDGSFAPMMPPWSLMWMYATAAHSTAPTTRAAISAPRTPRRVDDILRFPSFSGRQVRLDCVLFRPQRSWLDVPCASLTLIWGWLEVAPPKQVRLSRGSRGSALGCEMFDRGGHVENGGTALHLGAREARTLVTTHQDTDRRVGHGRQDQRLGTDGQGARSIEWCRGLWKRRRGAGSREDRQARGATVERRGPVGQQDVRQAVDDRLQGSLGLVDRLPDQVDVG